MSDFFSFFHATLVMIYYPTWDRVEEVDFRAYLAPYVPSQKVVPDSLPFTPLLSSSYYITLGCSTLLLSTNSY